MNVHEMYNLEKLTHQLVLEDQRIVAKSYDIAFALESYFMNIYVIFLKILYAYKNCPNLNLLKININLSQHVSITWIKAPRKRNNLHIFI